MLVGIHSRASSGFRRPGLDCAVCRSFTDGEGEVYFGVGGHSGFPGFTIGLEIFGLLSAEEEPREDRDEGPFPFIDSVSLDHEKEREPLVACISVLLSGVLGGVSSPTGMRGSTSLWVRLSLAMTSFSSIVARSWVEGGRVSLAHVVWRQRKRIHSRVY